MPYITLWISSPDTHGERRIGTDITISQLKLKLEPITGISYDNQYVRLQRTSTKVDTGHGGAGEGEGEKEVIAVLNDESRTLESYGAQEWMTLRVDSTDPNVRTTAGQFTDISKLENKFELTQEEYEAKSDTVLAYKQRNKLGRFADVPAPSGFVAPPPLVPASFKIGSRCQVSLSDDFAKRGVIRFMGRTKFGPQDGTVWIGVELDEPIGKGDGTVDGERYFKTGPLRASFVKPDKVEVGDFPELDPFADDDDEEMEM